MLLKLPSYLPDVFLVVVGVVALCAGAFWIYPPAGLLLTGVTLLTTAYVRRYLEVMSDEDPRASG